MAPGRRCLGLLALSQPLPGHVLGIAVGQGSSPEGSLDAAILLWRVCRIHSSTTNWNLFAQTVLTFQVRRSNEICSVLWFWLWVGLSEVNVDNSTNFPLSGSSQCLPYTPTVCKQIQTASRHTYSKNKFQEKNKNKTKPEKPYLSDLLNPEGRWLLGDQYQMLCLLSVFLVLQIHHSK